MVYLPCTRYKIQLFGCAHIPTRTQTIRTKDERNKIK